MIRKHKKYVRPRQRFDSERIKAENVIIQKYGLKNKKELWKAKAKLDVIRRQAKKLIGADLEMQERFLNKLKKMGFNAETTVDVLAFTEEDILNRRLETIVFKKGLATTPKGARQLITHKHIKVHGNVVNIPSYSVSIEDEGKIDVRLKPKREKKVEEEKVEEKPAKKMKEEATDEQSIEEVKEIVEEKKEDVQEEPKVEEATA